MYHLNVRFVQRSKGRSSVAGAAYRAGEKLIDERTGEVFDFRHKDHVTHKEIFLPGHVPAQLEDRATLWNTVELGLKRKDAQPAFQVEVALPRDLSPAQRWDMVREFVQTEFVAKGLIADVCVHLDKASDGGEHPHAHILMPTRRWRDDGSMDKAAVDMQDNPAILRKVYALQEAGKFDDALLVAKGTNLAHWRAAWADHQNDWLERHEHEDRVDHRTLKAQQIAREPMPNIGFAFHREVESLKGWLKDRVDAFKAFSRMGELRQQFDRIRSSRRDLTAEYIAMAREVMPELIKGLGFDEKEKGAGRDR